MSATADFTTAPSSRPARETAIWAIAYGAGIVVGCLAVGIAPLAAYVWLIALFGIPHVVSELRYVDERFSGRSSISALAVIGGLLAVLATMRVLGTYGVMDPMLSGRAELLLGAALAVAAALFMRKRKAVGLIAAAAITFGALYFPIPTFLIWAWLHNLTPMAFLAEALDGRDRKRALIALAVPFFLVPGFVALGGIDWIAQSLFDHDAVGAASAFDAGRKPLSAFLPADTRMADALHFFQAAVVCQVMHYVTVIGLMPRLLQRSAGLPGRLAPWPRWRVFYGLLALAGLASTAFYWASFTDARSAYALAAALHSWIELPVFLIALGGGFVMPAIAAHSIGQIRPAPTMH